MIDFNQRTAMLKWRLIDPLAVNCANGQSQRLICYRAVSPTKLQIEIKHSILNHIKTLEDDQPDNLLATFITDASARNKFSVYFLMMAFYLKFDVTISRPFGPPQVVQFHE